MITFYVSSYGKNDDKGIYIINLNEKNKSFLLFSTLLHKIIHLI